MGYMSTTGLLMSNLDGNAQYYLTCQHGHLKQLNVQAYAFPVPNQDDYQYCIGQLVSDVGFSYPMESSATDSQSIDACFVKCYSM